MTGGGAAEDGWDFFISYTRADAAWAEWIAWILEEANYRVLVQAWDFAPGSNWVARMDDGVSRAARTIAVLSEAYTRSMFGAAEWQAAWARDPGGTERRLLVARVGECGRHGLLGQVVSFDLFGMAEDVAEAKLLETVRLAVTGGRRKPETAPSFPRAVSRRPSFPGGSTETRTLPPRMVNLVGRQAPSDSAWIRDIKELHEVREYLHPSVLIEFQRRILLSHFSATEGRGNKDRGGDLHD